MTDETNGREVGIDITGSVLGHNPDGSDSWVQVIVVGLGDVPLNKELSAYLELCARHWIEQAFGAPEAGWETTDLITPPPPSERR